MKPFRYNCHCTVLPWSGKNSGCNTSEFPAVGSDLPLVMAGLGWCWECFQSHNKNVWAKQSRKRRSGKDTECWPWGHAGLEQTGRGRTQLQEKSEGKPKEAEGMRQGELNTRLFTLSPRTGADLAQLQEDLGWFGECNAHGMGSQRVPVLCGH